MSYYVVVYYMAKLGQHGGSDCATQSASKLRSNHEFGMVVPVWFERSTLLFSSVLTHCYHRAHFPLPACTLEFIDQKASLGLYIDFLSNCSRSFSYHTPTLRQLVRTRKERRWTAPSSSLRYTQTGSGSLGTFSGALGEYRFSESRCAKTVAYA